MSTGVRTIWKYELANETTSISMPTGALVLTAQTQHGRPVLWAEVDPNAPKVERRFVVLPTGRPYTQRDSNGRYIGTVQIDGGYLVYHVFEVIRDGEAQS